MAEGKNIAWKPILACIGCGVVGIGIGAFVIAPFFNKPTGNESADKDKKDDKKSSSSTSRRT